MFGAGMGSAANAIIDRLPKSEAWTKGRSHCDKCKHVLGVFDLVPIFSFLFLKGRCRYCHTQIPRRNLVVEIVMGIIAVISFQSPIINKLSIAQFLVAWVTVVIAVMDWETRMVSEILIVLWGILVISNQLPVISWMGALVGLLIIGGIWAVSRGKAMGFGDVEIAAVMGFGLGFPRILTALWLGFVIGAVVGLVLIFKNIAKAKSVIAFGPFLILGYWGAYIWGYRLVQYLLGGYV